MREIYQDEYNQPRSQGHAPNIIEVADDMKKLFNQTIIWSLEIHSYTQLIVLNQTQKTCPFVSIPAPAGITATHKKPVRVPQLSLSDIKTHLRPLLDRIDIHIEVPRVDYDKLSGTRLGETSEVIRARV